MEYSKQQRIRDFLQVYEFSHDDLAAYLATVAPGAAVKDGKEAQLRSHKNWWRDTFGQHAKPEEIKPIPRTDAGNSEFARAIWASLGVGDDAFTLNELVEYHNERLEQIAHARDNLGASKSMDFSNHMRNLDAEQRKADRNWFEESFKNSERIRNQKFDMNAWLHNPATCSGSQSATVHVHNPEAETDPMNIALRSSDGRRF